MNGKIMKVSSNDLYGNVDDRQVVVFAAFIHVKYMNRYVIFTYKDEYDKNKLYYGSVHLKDNSLVVFAIKNTEWEYINNFIMQYLSRNVNMNEFQIIDIVNINKVELVSFSMCDFNKLKELEELSIVKVNNIQEDSVKEKKYVFLYILLVVLILFLGGITYLYINPEAFSIELKMLNCEREEYNQKVDMDYINKREIRFNNKDIVKSVEITDVYTFSELDSYLDFKDNNRHEEGFNLDGGYKFDDYNLEFRIMYTEKSIIDSYSEMFYYLKNEGYNCIEGKYYE